MTAELSHFDNNEHVKTLADKGSRLPQPHDGPTWAARMVAMGCHVHPLITGRKAPATTNGLKDAEPDARRITGNYGVRTGASRIVVVDLDDYKTGERTAAFAADYDLDAHPTFTIKTGNGGTSRWYRMPEDADYANLEAGPTVYVGVDIKTSESYAVGPGSFITGSDIKTDGTGDGHYRHLTGHEIQPCPPRLHDLLVELTVQKRSVPTLAVTLVGNPADHRAWTEATLAGIASDLKAASDWPDGHTDEQGRGWEKLSADKAFRLAGLAIDGYTTEEAVRAVYFGNAPRDKRLDSRWHRQKWASQVRAAAAKPELRARPNVSDGDPFSYARPSTTPDAPHTPDPQDEDLPSSWAPVDLAPFLDGTWTAAVPTVMPRNDGVCLMYRGKVHSFHGEPESGKSLLLQIEAARLVMLGEDVLYLDFEDSAGDVAARLVTFGATRDAVVSHFTYVRPHDGWGGDGWAAWQSVLTKPYTLAVVDGVTDSLALLGLSSKDNDEIARWQKALPRAIARLTGAAVGVIDHVTKATDGRGRFALGGQAKLAGLDGAAYTVEPSPCPRKGHEGWIVLRCAKDRPGGVRTHCGPPRPSDRTQEAARVHIDSRGETPAVWWNPPSDAEGAIRTDDAAARQRGKKTAVMQLITDELATTDRPRSKRDLFGSVHCGKAEFDAALPELERRGYVALQDGPRRAVLVSLVKPYEAVFDTSQTQTVGLNT